MTTDVNTGLKMIVERAVRPVKATLERKKKMREEMLAHVTAVFEEERSKGTSEETALKRTSERFGHPLHIAEELQQTVPRYERPFLLVERITLPRPGEPTFHYAARTAVFISLIHVASQLVFLFPFAIAKGEPYHIGILWRTIFTIGVGAGLLTFAFILMSATLQDALFRREKRSYGIAFLITLISVATPSIIVFPLYCIVTGDIHWSVHATVRAMVVSPLIPFILFITCWKFDQERRYRQEWASLSLHESSGAHSAT